MLFALGLNEDPVVDRFMDDDVFDGTEEPKKPLLLLGASHLGNIAPYLDSDKWEIVNLCRRGFRINDFSISELAQQSLDVLKQLARDDVTAVIQLLDNSVYQVIGSDGTKYLPRADTLGVYHIDGSLQVSDKNDVRELVSRMMPLIKALGPSTKKIFLAPLTRYWLKPCCRKEDHLTNYGSPQYLPELGVKVHSLREFLRDSLYVRRASNFRVICPNRMLGIRSGLSDEDAIEASKLWGSAAVHPSADGYACIAAKLDEELSSDGKFTNAPKPIDAAVKRPRLDLSLSRQPWVEGCSAALPRADIHPPRGGGHSARGLQPRGSRGQRGRGNHHQWRKWSNGSSKSSKSHSSRGRGKPN
jgi:succinate dehydrogenase flavin-adding protein (antitoxin of CptAB toxin-antitoxin module)